MKKIIFAVMLALSVIGAAAEAKEYIDCKISDNNIVTIENKIDGVNKAEKISLVVYRPGKTYEDLATDLSVIAACEQGFTDAKGNYSFQFKLDSESGFYVAEITTENQKECKVYEFYYSNPKQTLEYLTKLNESKNGNDVYDLLYGKDLAWEKLGFFMPFEANFDKINTSNILYNILSKGKFSTVEQAVEAFKESATIQLLNESFDISADEFEKYLNFKNKSYYEDYYSSLFTDAARKKIINDIKGKNIKSVDDFDLKLQQQIILKTAEYAKGYGNIIDILKKYSSICNISSKEYSNLALQSVVGKSFSDFEVFKKALDSFVVDNPNDKEKTPKENEKSDNSKTTYITAIGNNAPQELNSIEKKYFTDIDNFNWAKEAINYLFENGIVTGKKEEIFAPSENITREEFTAIVVRAFNLKLNDEESLPEFNDVKEGAWYENSIKVAYSNNVIMGKNKNNFGVGEKITRQDIAVILARVLNLDENAEADSFIDDYEINDYAKNAVYLMKNKGIIAGYEDKSFKPHKNSTRAEAAVMIYRAMTK